MLKELIMLISHIDNILAQAVNALDRYPMTLVMDRSSIHNVDKIKEAFIDRGCQCITNIILLPPMSAKRLSPLDNTLFHDWKERIRKRCPITEENIEQLMNDEWDILTSKQLHAYYKHCRLVDQQDVYSDCPDREAHAH
jgi:hypothetical protein